MQVFLVGFMGSGKTTAGKRLAKLLDLGFIDLDHTIEAEYKMSIPEIFKQYDENVFRLLEKSTLHKVTERSDDVVVSTGGGTPCFYDNMDYMLNRGLVIYLHLEVPTLVRRIMQSHTQRPLVLSKDHQELTQRVEELLQQRESFYRRADLHFDARNLRIESLIPTIKESIRIKQLRASG